MRPAGPICPSVTPSLYLAPASFFQPTLLAPPVSQSTGCHPNPLFRRSWRHCYLRGRYPLLTVVGPVLDVCRLWTRAQVTLRVCSHAAQNPSSACRASSLIALSASCMVNLQGHVAASLDHIRCHLVLSYPRCAGDSLALRQYLSALVYV